jgi:hypothetical protein
MSPTPTPTPPAYFDYPAVAREAGIGAADLRAIIHIFEADYPHDLMLRELHILRACNAVKAGRVALADILRESPPASAA